MQFFHFIHNMNSDNADNKNKNIGSATEHWTNASSDANQSDIVSDIFIEEPPNSDDESDDEIDLKLHIPPKLIYFYENSKPFYAKDEFIDSMSDIFMIESLSHDNLSSNQNM